MSDTTTPSAAEVMGWHAPPKRLSDATKLCASCGTPFDPPMTKRSPCCGDCWYDLSEWYAYAPKPTPDDMLAWLVAHNYRIDDINHDGVLEVISYQVTFGPIVEAVYADAEGQWPTFDIEAPTLHAALEQAVIAVGRAE